MGIGCPCLCLTCSIGHFLDVLSVCQFLRFLALVLPSAAKVAVYLPTANLYNYINSFQSRASLASSVNIQKDIKQCLIILRGGLKRFSLTSTR